MVQRQQLADGLVRYLTTLGLKRVARDTESLDDYVKRKYGTDDDSAAQDTPESTQGSQDDHEAKPDEIVNPEGHLEPGCGSISGKG